MLSGVPQPAKETAAINVNFALIAIVVVFFIVEVVISRRERAGKIFTSRRPFSNNLSSLG
jgi:hypothetical protein